MASVGLFTRQDAKSALKRPKKDETPWHTIAALGAKGAKGFNPKAKTPNLQPSGDCVGGFYALAWHPNETEDRDGEAGVGTCGRYLRKHIPKGIPVRHGHCIRTFPGQLEIQPHLAQCFRQDVEDDIQNARPWAVLALGSRVGEWAVRLGVMPSALRGRRFPVKFGTHTCWVYTLEDPEVISEALADTSKKFKNDAWDFVFRHDMKRILRDHAAKRKAVVLDEAVMEKNVQLHTKMDSWDAAAVCAALEDLADQDVGVDLETTWGRPYQKDGKILSMSVGNDAKTIAFALHHPQARWKKDDLAKIIASIKVFVAGRGRKIFHNMSFDLEWLAHAFGEELVMRSALRYKWECTQVQCFVLDERSGGQSLNFLTKLNFGVACKELSAVDRTKLAAFSIDKVLEYNAGDVKWDFNLWKTQNETLQAEGLFDAYRFRMACIPALVGAQLRGMPVDQKATKQVHAEYTAKLLELQKAIDDLPETATFRKRYGPFRASKTEHVELMIEKVLGKTIPVDPKTKKKKVDKVALKAVGGQFCAAILKHRAADKLYGTYIDPLLATSEKSVVWPDGKIHTSFNHTFTVTGRTSSDNPNMQNFPKRDAAGKKVRRLVVPSPGHLFIAVDYGQIEARMIAVASQDKVFLSALRDNYDVHLEWANIIYKMWPRTADKRYPDMSAEDRTKKFRNDIKNQMVFPAFFGAGEPSIARSLEMDIAVLSRAFQKFWKMFAGVKTWQEILKAGYEKNGWVATLNGQRRHGPMSPSEIINSPIQGTAAELKLDAMRRCAIRSYKERKYWLQPHLDVHDDLTFEVPEDRFKDGLYDIIETMTCCPFDWLNVPIQVEAAAGYNWCDLHEIVKTDNLKYQSVLKSLTLPTLAKLHEQH